MEIVICGRNVEVPEHFRDHTTEKLARLGRYDHKIVRLSVELSHEPNPRRAKSCQCVQITGRGRGPVVRAVGCAADFYCALDQALGRLEGKLRRAHDRRRVHHGRRQPISVARATAAGLVAEGGTGGVALLEQTDEDVRTGSDAALAGVPASRTPSDDVTGDVDPGDVDPGDVDPDDTDSTDADVHTPGRIARYKEHHAVPMTVDDALSQMELVGHDFFLFADEETGRPSVVYRRHAYDYGVIALV